MNVREYNRDAWNASVENEIRWTIPVSKEEIEAARKGEFSIVLTPQNPVPREWFPDLKGLKVLGLASGGGQQMPVLAAAGAEVVSYDNSPRQLEQDRKVAERESLSLTTVEGDMRDLGVFEDESFDFIFHPCSNSFVPDVNPVWKEAFRVLRPGGTMVSGFCNPVLFIFDYEKLEKAGELEVRHEIPYSDLTSLSEAERREMTEKSEPLCFGHTLEDQIGGQLRAGFHLTGLFEDKDRDLALCKYIPAFVATRALKPSK